MILVEENENDKKLAEMENKKTRNIEQPQPHFSKKTKKTKKFGWKYLHSRKSFLDKNLKRSRTLTMDPETVNENTGNVIFPFSIALNWKVPLIIKFRKILF